MPDVGSVDGARLGAAVEAYIVDELVASNVLGLLLEAQAARRMMAGGDSEHSYPEVWRGGQPLLDTGNGMRALWSKTERQGDTLTATLHDGAGYLVFHQHGFVTDGPNYIPLTNRGKVEHTLGQNPLEEGLVRWGGGAGKPNHKIDEVTGQLVETEQQADYMMAWRGVSVPQRKVFNLPPEDVAELQAALEVS